MKPISVSTVHKLASGRVTEMCEFPKNKSLCACYFYTLWRIMHAKIGCKHHVGSLSKYSKHSCFCLSKKAVQICSLSAFGGYRITESSLGINQTKVYCKANTYHRDQKRLAAIIHIVFGESATLGKCKFDTSNITDRYRANFNQATLLNSFI